VSAVLAALGKLLVQQPLHILGVAAFFFVLWMLLKRRHGALLVPAFAWLAYAAWEWLVLVRTPQADIRVDLLVIWPLVAMAMLWPLVKAFFPRRSRAGQRDA
jgi:hypothetical protein